MSIVRAMILPAAALAMVLGTGCEQRSAAQPTASQPAAAQDSPAAPTGFAPISHFNESCARCHGPYGAFFGANLQARDDADLQMTVQRMAAGPGGAVLQPQQVQILSQYVRSIGTRKPFVVVTQITGGGAKPLEVSGELTPGAKVTVRTPKQTAEAQVTQHTWTAALPADADPRTVRAEVR